MATVFYKSLKIFCSINLDFYFRKWQVHGKNNIPEGPVLFVSNHQNAFLDAVLLTCSSVKNPWYITRANVFENKTAAGILHSLQMLPIYRFRDGYATLKKNEQVMDNVVQMLNRGKSVLIFAEGNQGDRYQLRPLQKGAARIAMAVDESARVAIVPVGIQYDSRTAFRSRVLVNFGKPVYVTDIDLSHINIQDRLDAFLMAIRIKLQPLLLHIESIGYEEKWNYLMQHRQFHDDLYDQLTSDQAIIDTYPEPAPVSTFPKQSTILQRIFMGYVKINSVVPYFIIRNLILARIKDPQFTGSVKYAAGMFVAPVFWLLQAIIIFYFTASLALALCYLASIPVSVKLS